MATVARIGYGAAFLTSNRNTPRTWRTMGEVTNLTLPQMTQDIIDVGHEQPPDSWRESIAGFKDGAEATIDFNLDPDGVDALALMAEWELAGNASAVTRRIVFPDGSYMEFDGILIGFDSSLPVADAIRSSARFKVTGKPTLVPLPTWALSSDEYMHLDFINNRAFKDGFAVVTADSLLTTTRASAAYAPNAAGVYTLFAANVPRITNLGLLVETARTNYQVQTAGMVTGWTITPPNTKVVSTDLPPLFSGGAILKLTRDNGTADANVLAYTLGPPGAWTFNTVYTASIYVWIPTSASNVTMARWGLEVSTAPWTAINANANLSLRDQWQKLTFSTTSGASGTAAAIFVFRLGCDTGSFVYVTAPQFEIGGHASSWIPTTTVAVQRAADVCYVPSIPNPSDVTLFAQCIPQNTFGQFNMAASYSDGTIQNRLELYRVNTNGTALGITTVGNVNGTVMNSLTVWAQNARGKISGSASATAVPTMVFNGGATAAGTGAWPPAAGNFRFEIGQNANIAQLDGLIEHAGLWLSAKSDTFKRTITS